MIIRKGIGNRKCADCKGVIERGRIELERSVERKWYHIECYKPSRPSPLWPSDFQPIPEESPASPHIRAQAKSESLSSLQAALKCFTDVWNRQFTVSDSLISAIFLRNSVLSITPGPRKRLYLIVFQYLSVTELEQCAALVSKLWLGVTREAEMWLLLCQRDYSTEAMRPADDLRRRYIACFQAACFSCRSIPPLSKVVLKCPIHKQNLCVDCKKTVKLMDFRSISEVFYVEKEAILAAGVAFFTIDATKHCYFSAFQRDFVPYAQSRKAKLLSLLKSMHKDEALDRVAAEMEQFDVAWFYRQGALSESGTRCWFPLSKVNLSLLKFCGAVIKRDRYKSYIEGMLKHLLGR